MTNFLFLVATSLVTHFSNKTFTIFTQINERMLEERFRELTEAASFILNRRSGPKFWGHSEEKHNPLQFQRQTAQSCSRLDGTQIHNFTLEPESCNNTM